MCNHHTKGKHLTQEDRVRIEAYCDDGKNYTEISKILQVETSTIWRELKKCKKGKSYCSKHAQEITEQRRLNSKIKYRKIGNNPKLAMQIEIALHGDSEKGDYSPDVIANTICKGIVSTPTIYKWIKTERKDLFRYLPKQGKKYRKRGPNTEYGTIKATKPKLIDERPFESDDRSVVGHFEGDTMRGGKKRAYTLVERVSRFIISRINRFSGSGMALSLADDMVEDLLVLPKTHLLTITYDQGSEFAWWEDMEARLGGTQIYFAHPHSPWERGTNERSNGLERRYFPKSTDFDIITDEEYASVIWMINHRPRKILNWRTPCEVFGACCNSSFN